MSYIDKCIVLLDCGVLGELEAEAEFEYSFDPGRYTGAWENCYPSSEECDVLKLTIDLGKGPIEVPIDDTIKVTDLVCEQAAEMYRERLKQDRDDRDYDQYESRAMYREFA